MLDPQKVKQDFPILVNNPDLSYLDSAATSQKPTQVIQAISDYYQKSNANVHRGVHHLSDEATKIFEDSRKTIADFFGAQTEELILTRNTTESINGVAYAWALNNLKEDDVILTSVMEHHSNLVPWQEVAKRTGAKLEYLDVDKFGRLDLAQLRSKMQDAAQPWRTSASSVESHAVGCRIRLLALSHVSNVTGVVNSIEETIKECRIQNEECRIFVDGAQAAPHMKINFDKLGVDFYALSGHKMLGPMGAGVLLVKKELLESEEFRPWLFGGGMIDSVSTAGTKFNENLNERFVAGTPDVASAVGLAAACNYLSKIGMENVEQHDKGLVEYAIEKLNKVENIQLVGPLDSYRLGSVAFIYKGVHAHDVAQVLDSEGIAVRSGHHCCMPLHEFMGWQATVRASFNVYNDTTDINNLTKALSKVKSIFL